jgi:thioredoxin reductase (NADPH)
MADYDVLVVGGGLAGLTAGLYAARYGRSTLVLEPAVPGGHLINVEKIEQFPGFPDGASGYELGPNTQLQAMNAGAEFSMAEAQALTPDNDGWLVATTDGDHRARAVVVATGARPRPLGVPGEERLYGKGVSHCASCDGPLFRGETVGVAAGGDWALQEALTLANHAARVIVFHPVEAFVDQHAYQQRVAETPAIVVRHTTTVTEVLGESAVSGVRVKAAPTGQQDQLELAGLFVYAGLEPNTAFLKDLLHLDDSGHVPTDVWMRTERPGLFAAGDVRQNSAGQAITAAGDGATAATAAHRYLQDKT